MININIHERDLRWLKTGHKFIQEAANNAMPKLALFLEGEAKKNFNGPDQLKVRTGNLRRSIVGEVSNKVASIGTDVIYGRIHELGGPMPGGWVMRKRPYLMPAIDDNEDKIEDMLLEELLTAWKEQ